MPKGPKVTPEIEALIAETSKKYPKWKAPEVRREVEHILKKARKPGITKGYPSLSTVQKILAKVRKPYDDSQEQPWSMATLDDAPISPEALPVVLEVWKFRVARDEGFTIREAKWTARLSRVLKDIRKLSGYARQYARLEQIYQIIERPLDTAVLDGEIVGIPSV